MQTSILLDHEPVADGGFLVHALLRIEGAAPPDEDRTPLNLSLVLDRSGSMWGEKLHAAREAAVQLVRRLAPEDVVSVIAYDEDVQVVAPPATGEDQEDLVRRIREIGPGGSTNLSGGWLRGMELVRLCQRTEGVNRVILLTDGLANVGVTEPSRLVELAANGAGGGISTTTIGFGQGYDEDLLRAMADAGRGGTWYVEKADQAAGIFDEELQGLLSLAAQNVQVFIHPDRHADAAKVLHEYPESVEGDVLSLQVGDLYAREPRKVLMEFLIPPEVPDLAWVATVTVRAHVLAADGGVELQTVDLPITFHPVEGGSVEPEVRREVLLVAAARARQEALEARDRGDWDAARARLEEVLEKGRPLADDPEVAEELRDLEATAQRFLVREVDEADVKYMKQRSYSTHRSRRGTLDSFSRESPDGR